MHIVHLSLSSACNDIDFLPNDILNPFPNGKFKTSKLREFADDNFKFDENGRKFLKQVENTVEKGEISPYEQFLISPQWFQKTCRYSRHIKIKARLGKD